MAAFILTVHLLIALVLGTTALALGLTSTHTSVSNMASTILMSPSQAVETPAAVLPYINIGQQVSQRHVLTHKTHY
jgi:hypothetical protein